MEFYAPAKGAPSSFATGIEASPASDIAGGGSSLAFYDEWRAHSKHGGGTQRSAAEGGSSIGVVDAVGASPPSEESGWAMTMQGQEGGDGGQGPYPERAGEPDCVYYMRTGLCGFGVTCRFNHPANRKLAAVVARGKGEYPERVGQPECQYYLKTGTCKFGATCKYHHPREKAGSTGRVQLSVLGLPLRLGEKECAYYMRTGSCKYGVTCKFHHPQPTTVGGMVSMSFGSGGGPSSPAPQGYPAGTVPSWQVPRSPFPLPRLQTHSSYGPMVPLQQGIMSMPGWSYQGPVGPHEGHQQSYVFGGSPQGEHVPTYAPYMQGSAAVGLPAHPASQTVGVQKESLFPERPGQPECQYYMKTGDCKFGTTCRYHHPKDRATPAPTCLLSPMGLPLRPGNPPCSFYTRYGICKFGPTCKFHHPLVGSFHYSMSVGSIGDGAAPPYPIGSSPMNLAPSAYSEGILERQGSGEAGGYAEDGSGQHESTRSSSEGGEVSLVSVGNGGVGGSGSGSGGKQAESVGKS